MAYADDDITFDFWTDWKAALGVLLSRLGYASPSDDVETRTLQYFNVLKRRVRARPRHVHTARELVCPLDVQAGFDALQEKFREGRDVMPHLSRGLLNLDYDDGMLNDWGVYHFHLGAAIEADGFVMRTGPVAYAHLNDTAVYFIDVKAHGAWTEKRLLAVLHSNWPEITKPYVPSGWESDDAWTDEQHKRLRRAGFTTVVTLDDGTVLAPIGGGIMKSGLSTEVRQVSNEALNQIRRFEEHVRARKQDVLAAVEETGVAPKRPMRLSLAFGPEWAVALRVDGIGKQWLLGRLL